MKPDRKKVGRKPYAVEDKTVPGSIRLTPEHWALLRELSVDGWLRPKLDEILKLRKRYGG